MTPLRFARGQGRAGPAPVPTLHDTLWWLLALGIVVAAVRLFYVAVTPVAPLGDWRPAGVRLVDDATRTALLSSFDPFNRSAPGDVVAVAAGPDVITDLPLTLYGIRSNAVTGGGTAIIAGADGQQELYRIGEEVLDGATLAGLAFDHVILNRNNARELLYLDQSEPAPVTTPAQNEQATPASPANNALSAASLRRGIAINPRAGGGGVTGLEVSATGDGSAFRAAGLRAGDVVVAVDGSRITSAGDLSRMASQIKPGGKIALTVQRGENEVPVSIEVAP